MLIGNHNARFLCEDLPTVLTAFYNADELRRIVPQLVLPFQQQPHPDRKLNKAELVSLVQPLLQDAEHFYPFFEFFPKPLQKLLTHLAWEGDCPLDSLEAALGFRLASRKTIKSRYAHFADTVEVERLPDFVFVAIEIESAVYSYKGETRITVRLPRVIRNLLCATLPEKPKGYDIEAVTDADIFTPYRYQCSDQIPSDLQRLSDFIDKKHLKLTQSDHPNKASLRQANQILGNREFYPPSRETPKLEHIRTELLISLLRALPKGMRSDFAHSRLQPTHLRQLMDFVEEHPHWVFENLLPHLTTREYQIRCGNDAWFSFQELIRNLPVGEWVTYDNLVKHHRYRGHDYCFCFNSSVMAKIDSHNASGYYGDLVPLTRQNAAELVELPLIRGITFLLATLGFAEIAYHLPPEYKGACKPRSTPWLTPFDGIHAIRITPEGAYAFGHDQEIQLQAPEDPRSRITLNPNCLNAICHDIDPVTELSLLQFMEKISPGHYRLTRDSLLRGCSTRKEATTRFETFKDTIGSELPPLWQSFCEHTVATCVALKQVQGYRVYQLEKHPELRQLFATDPFLRIHCIRAEGFKILIENKAVADVQKHLRTLGYLTI
jgi:hypothetical protein